MSNLPNNFSRNSSIVKEFNVNTFVENEIYTTDIFVKPEDMNEAADDRFTGDEFTFTANESTPVQLEQICVGTALKLSDRISEQPLNKYVVGVICVVAAIASAAYPIAMNRLNQNGKFAQSEVKSLTRESKPANPSS
jgi:hypothetical protein